MFQTNKIKILAISGSLKSTSSNSAILSTIKEMSYPDLEFFIYNDLENIPPFHPEKENGTAAVKAFRQLVNIADAILISTPEYAFGVPGVLKNALDWLVSSGELNDKPAAAVSASPMYSGGDKALASLLLTLGALGTKMDTDASLSIPDILNKMKNGRITDSGALKDLESLVNRLVTAIKTKPEQS